MKKIYYIILLAAATLFCIGNVSGQKIYNGGISFEHSHAEKRGDQVVIQATVNLNNLEMHRQQMVTITPILRSNDRVHSQAFDPVVIMGKTRQKAVARGIRLNNFWFDPVPGQEITYSKKGNESVSFLMEAAYQPWMRDAELVFNEEVTGCGFSNLVENQYRLISRILPPVVAPTYNITYITPPAEEVKQRSESYAARLNFRVARYEILHDFMNNATVLNEVNKIISEIKNDQNLTITEFKVTGYASPEGAAQSNMVLSENRARAFVNYVRDRHNISSNAIQVDWKGDDWNGLVKLMQESPYFTERYQVIDIVNNEGNVQTRKNKLKNLGTAYRTLLNDYYPMLRRNEYTIAYVARPFSIDEAKELIRTKPQYLSLNEMFLVANSYPKDSRNFKEVFDIAVRMYPDSEYAKINSAALDRENGAYDAALQRLQGVEMPEAWNNIGYIYIQKKEYDKAAESFRRAAHAGSSVASENLDQLTKWLENPE